MSVQSQTTVGVRIGWQPNRNTPATSLREIPRVEFSVEGDIETIESNRIRSDRMTDEVADGMESVAGDLTDEVAIGDHDDYIQALLGGTWTAVGAVSGAVTFDGTAGTATRIGGWGSLFPGAVVDITGTEDNAGRYRIRAIVGNVASLVDLDGAAADLVDEVADEATITGVGFVVKNGKLRRYFTAEVFMPDVEEDQYQVTEGNEIDGASITVQPGGIVSARYAVQGRRWYQSPTPIDLAVDDTVSGALLSAVSGRLLIDGIAVELVTSAEISIGNGTAGDGVVGSRYRAPTTQGRTTATASLTMLVDSTTMKRRLRQGIEVSLAIELQGGGEFLCIVLPRCRVMSVKSPLQGEGSLAQSVELKALRDAVTNAMVLVQRSNA